MSDLIDVLKATPSGEGKTTRELLLEMGWEDTAFYRSKLLARLRPEVASGRVLCENAIRSRIDGRPTKIPVYRMK